MICLSLGQFKHTKEVTLPGTNTEYGYVQKLPQSETMFLSVSFPNKRCSFLGKLLPRLSNIINNQMKNTTQIQCNEAKVINDLCHDTLTVNNQQSTSNN